MSSFCADILPVSILVPLCVRCQRIQTCSVCDAVRRSCLAKRNARVGEENGLGSNYCHGAVDRMQHANGNVNNPNLHIDSYACMSWSTENTGWESEGPDCIG